MTPSEALDQSLDRLFAETGSPRRLGIAVSGGSDSLGLMYLLSDWAKERDTRLFVATVDHGLRPEAAAEARIVAALAMELDLPHSVHRWSGWDGSGNLADAARRARYQLLGDWAAAETLDAIALGHTEDDQAETLLMNLARGSGVEGLSGIAETHRRHGYRIIRPLLGVARSALQHELKGRDITWIDDPSNADPTSERVKARAALANLEPLGIDTRGLTATAGRMSAARQALQARAHNVAEKIVFEEQGDLVVDADGLFEIEADTRHRIFAAALSWVASELYRPRLDALIRLMALLEEGGGGTLHGCLIRQSKGKIRVSRELNAVADLSVPATPGAVWDHRWRLSSSRQIRAGDNLAALGQDGLEQMAVARHEIPTNSPPRDSLAAAPALWRDGHLIAAPLAGFGALVPIILAPPHGGFLDTFLSH